ncbi:nuclear transport factor 2 family protein [Pseudohalioglobus lutimaris]|uniref:Nuclear transport factor 2 family protein n=1 Tax=Pseudohalioglobus lutimaris TaxID=1737061 RepID=A0A2N5X5I2_9GAMM|nr:nuclear transport factor 2 family protein [Pseudohalioglobus lutimaris]PLW69746.1 nuclear transport factor 2 family protein [Pseudohalioglobus lutimaris]
MDARLQALLDKQDITDLVYAYCNASDRHDLDKLRQLYHPDATDDHGGFFKGLAMEFIDQLPQIQAPMEILHHNVTNINLALDGDYAEGEIYVLAFHRIRTDAEPMDLLIGGRYFDRYEKREGVWKYSARAVVADWATVNNPSTVQLDHPLVQGSHIGKPGLDDPSYDFFKLLKWGER